MAHIRGVHAPRLPPPWLPPSRPESRVGSSAVRGRETPSLWGHAERSCGSAGAGHRGGARRLDKGDRWQDRDGSIGGVSSITSRTAGMAGSIASARSAHVAAAERLLATRLAERPGHARSRALTFDALAVCRVPHRRSASTCEGLSSGLTNEPSRCRQQSPTARLCTPPQWGTPARADAATARAAA